MRKVSNPDLVVVPNRCTLYQQTRSTRWYCRIKMEDGTWYRIATQKFELERAKDRALELYYETRVKSKNNLPTNSRSFSSVAKAIVKRLEALKDTSEWKPTYQSYIYVITKYQIPYFAQARLDNIRSKYEGYIGYVTEQLGKQPKQSTISNHHAALKLILTEATEKGWANNSTLPTLKSAGKQSTRRPTFELSEYHSLISKLKTWSEVKSHRHKDTEIRQMLYDYVLILAHSGIRHGREAMDIKWANISFGESAKGNEIVTINVVKKKGRKGTEDRRSVVVRHNHLSDFKEILERIKNRNTQLASKMLSQIVSERIDVPLFCLSDGTQPKRLDGTFNKFLIEAELEYGSEQLRRTLYSFRHFYATQELLREPPITIYLLSKQMGTSVKMIEKHYGHTEPYQKADRLSGWRDAEQ